MQACWVGYAGELGWVVPVYKVRKCRRTGTAEERGSLAVMSERAAADVWRCITGVNAGVVGESVLVGVRSRASVGEASVGEASVGEVSVGEVSCVGGGGVGGACAGAPPMGAGCGVCFGRLSSRWRVRAADRVPPDWGSLRRRRGRWGLALLGGFHLIGCNTPSVRSNMVESVLLAPFGVVLVLPVTCRVARSARGRT